MRSSRPQAKPREPQKGTAPKPPATPEQQRLRRRVRLVVLGACLLGLAAVGYFSLYPMWQVSHYLGRAERHLLLRPLYEKGAGLRRLGWAE